MKYNRLFQLLIHIIITKGEEDKEDNEEDMNKVDMNKVDTTEIMEEEEGKCKEEMMFGLLGIEK